MKPVSRRAIRFVPVYGDAVPPLASLVVLALVLGGGGEHYPLVSGLLGVASLGLAISCGPAIWRSPRTGQEKVALILLAGLFLVVLAQTVPLPPAVADIIPGRGLMAQTEDAMGWSHWRPLSMTPDLTFDVAVALLPPGLVFLTARGVSARQRILVVRGLVAFAMLAACLGALQVASGPETVLTPWETSHQGLGIGLFVNRNHQAALLLVAIVLAGVRGGIPFESWFRARGETVHRLLVGIVLAVLACGVLATLSRTGLALLPLALAMACGLRVKGRGRLLGLLFLAALAAGGVLMGVGVASQAFARFDLVGQDSRWQYWQNSWLLLRQVWPTGSGFGSFVPLYQQIEPLNEVVPLFVNHAHDDLLEWVIEGGLPALWLMLAGVVLYGRALVAAVVAHARGEDGVAPAGGGACLVLLLCSVTDFPLRMVGLSVVFAFCSALLLAAPIQSAERGASALTRPQVIASWMLGGLAAALTVVCAISQSALQAGDWSTALQWAPWRAQAWASRAQEELRLGHRAEAIRSAGQALRIEPLNVMAVRTMGMASELAGDRRRASAMLAVTGALGWRDALAQVWLATEAEALGNRDYEVARIDALLRQNVMEGQAMAFLTAMATQADGAQAVIERIKDRPGWRQGFLNRLADQTASEPAMAVWFVDRANRHGAGLTAAELNLMIWRLADTGAYAEARHIWIVGGGQGLIGDGDFRGVAGRVPEQSAPFQWRSPQQTNVQVYGDTGSGERVGVLRIVSDGRVAGPALAQTLMLPIGRYRLHVSMDRPDGAPSPLPVWSVSCLSAGAQAERRAISLTWSKGPRGLIGEGGFDIPAGCAAQDLAMQIPANNFQDFQIALQRVAVDYVK